MQSATTEAVADEHSQHEQNRDEADESPTCALSHPQVYSRNDTELTVDDENDVSDQEDPPSALAVHPVNIGDGYAPEETGECPATLPSQAKCTMALGATTDSSRAWRLEIVPLILLSLPIDALHCIASFVTTGDWASFGQTSLGANRVCREVFRRVRMHGFRCATEVVTAWKIGQHADARELAGLYIQSGVPIYPHSLGHSYHTLVWRMGTEAQDMERAVNRPPARTTQGSSVTNNERGTDPATEETPDHRPIDLFSEQRHEGGDSRAMSYLEEKCMFWYNHDVGPSRCHISLNTRANFAPPAAPILAASGVGHRGSRFPGFRPDPSPTRSSTVSENIKLQRIAPKVTVKIHRHLVDQHMMGRRPVDDENGAMQASPVSLAADFFHPPVNASTSSLYSRDTMSPDNFLRPDQKSDPDFLATPSKTDFGRLLGDHGVFGDEEDVSRNELSLDRRSQLSQGGMLETPQPFMSSIVLSPPRLPQASSDDISPEEMLTPERSIFRKVELDIYNSASANLTTLSEHSEGTSGRTHKSHLKTRFAVYQRRLEVLLTQCDSNGFEECILDFWDEFLPVTANIQFYDRHTAVPRLSALHKFMSKPCPKAIGIVQCEIERIKITSKKKGVNMKGRLFPSYEYRLFIRDRRQALCMPEASVLDEYPPRRDTILMMAKNRGRNYHDRSGVAPAQGSSKKGVNNYYLQLPQQNDIDIHFNSVNSDDHSVLKPNGAGNTTPRAFGEGIAPVLLGRLQSNFIGTEFQIFTPTFQKLTKRGVPSVSDSENDLDYDSGVSSDTNMPMSSSRRRNRFSRRKSPSHRKKDNINESTSFQHHRLQPDPIVEEVDSVRSPSNHRVRRSYSLPIMGRTSRSSRRAVAHSEAPENMLENMVHQATLCEEEDGAITYTANLLGNRPRIMDVCVPKVSDDGAAAAQWKRYLESLQEDSDPTVGNRMLTHFKQLQQRLESPDQTSTADDETEGVPTSDYTPPDDFGLLALQNRPPWWNIELGAFVLNFGGRVSVASVKNFQLCDRNDPDHIMLQFGRIQGRHSFTMDFQFPLSPVQAFAIAISSLQSRISFG